MGTTHDWYQIVNGSSPAVGMSVLSSLVLPARLVSGPGSVPGLPSHDRLLGHGCAQTSKYNPTKTPVKSTDSARTQTTAPKIADELAMLVAYRGQQHVFCVTKPR